MKNRTTLLLFALWLTIPAFGQTIMIGSNQYAFQYTVNTNYGMYFNATGSAYELRNSAGAAVFSVDANNGDGSFAGKLTVANNVLVGNNVRFTGTGALQVAGNRYAFQYLTNTNYGLFFNASAARYEFKDAQANNVFFVHANNGNVFLRGKLGQNTLNPSTLIHSIDTTTFDDNPAILGQHIVSDYYGIGVKGEGKWIGVAGESSISGNQTYIGLYGASIRSSGTGGTLYGVYGDAFGGITNVGVYGSAAPDSANGSSALYGNGDLTITGNVYQLSENRFKKEVHKIENASELLEKITGYFYQMETPKPGLHFALGRQSGFLAAEVEEAMPWLVRKTTHPGMSVSEKIAHQESYRAVNYPGMIPVLVNALKEQKDLIEKQENRLLIQDARIEALEALVTELLNQNGENTKSEKRAPEQRATLGLSFPNPTSGVASIPYFVPEKKEAVLKIYALSSGKEMASYPVKPGNGRISLQLGEFSPGLYLATLIVDGNPAASQKLIVK